MSRYPVSPSCGSVRVRPRAVLGAALLAAGIGLMVGPARAADAAVDPPGVKTVKSLLEARHEGVIIQKWDISCGAAALATLLTYQHGDPVPEAEIAKAMLRTTADAERVQRRKGFSLLDLKAYVDARGYEGIGYGRMTLADLVEMAPLIVPVRFRTYNHFVVFRGVVGDRVLLADPAFGNRSVRVERFLDAWIGNYGFVVRRTDGRPVADRLAPGAGELYLPAAAAIRQAVQ